MATSERPPEVQIVDPRLVVGPAEYDKLDTSVLPPVMKSYAVLSEPKMSIIPNFLTDSEIEHVLKISNDYWEPSKVGSGTYKTTNESEDLENNVSQIRTSSSCMLRSAHTEMVKNIEVRLSRLAGIDVEFLERLNMVRYRPGQFFKEHHDGRFRPITVFLYLNDLPDGDDGETLFPELGIKITPRKGCAVMWSNVLGPQQDDKRMVHQGLPPLTGIKFGINCFFNDKPLKQYSEFDDFGDDPATRAPPLDYEDIYNTIDPDALGGTNDDPSVIQAFAVNTEPVVSVVPKFLSDDEAAIMLQLLDPEATVSQAVVDQVQSRMALLADLPKECMSMKLSRCGIDDFRQAVPSQDEKVVFVFLNEVELGGEVRFVNLGLQVRSRCGAAVVWPISKMTSYHLRAPRIGTRCAIVCSFASA